MGGGGTRYGMDHVSGACVRAYVIFYDMAGPAAPRNSHFPPESEFVLDRIFEFVLGARLHSVPGGNVACQG